MSSLHSKKLVVGVVLIVCIGTISAYIIKTDNGTSGNCKTTKVEASTNQSILSSQGDWNQGSKNNITVAESGTIEMDSKTGGGFGSEIPIESAQIVTDLPNKDNLIDDDLGTYLTVPGDGSDHTIRINFDSTLRFYMKFWTNDPDFAHNNIHVYTDEIYPGGGQFGVEESLSCDLAYTCVNNGSSFQSFDHVIIRTGSWDVSTDIHQIKLYQAPAETEISLAGKTISADPDTDKENVRDGNLSTGWGPGAHNWTVDLGEITPLYARGFVYPNFGIFSGAIQYGDDGTNFSNFPPTGPTYNAPSEYHSTNVSARYVRFFQATPYPHQYMELKLFVPFDATATHTSAATQITDTNFYQWQTFSPTYTEPANTDISFKFRTSTDSSTWTAWTASQTVASGGSLDITDSVTSSTGDPGSETFYKYIQVESTLTSSDGVSTPTLSDYTIGYHTNVKPASPTPGSVTIGS